MDAYDEEPNAPRGVQPPPALPEPRTSRSAQSAGTHDPQAPDRPAAPHHPTAQAAPTAPAAPAEPPRPAGLAALPLPHRIGAVAFLAVVAVAVCTHLGMVFLHVAPPNTVTARHGGAVDEWIYPEFEQNWKLFAPNPLQQDIAVQARAEVRTPDGGTRTTGWYDLSAQDGRAIRGNPLPSHTQQNELRRAWDFFVAAHAGAGRPVGLRGALSERYLRRIVVLRLERAGAPGPGGTVERVQVRARTTNVPPPKWSREKVSTAPVLRALPWWPVPSAEAEGGVR
jgi:hypothetical protein